MIEVMNAYDNGENIEWRMANVMGEPWENCSDSTWEDCPDPNWDWCLCDYRVKVIDKYIPYDDTNELFVYNDTSQPIWFKEKRNDAMVLMTAYGENWVELNRYVYGMQELFNNFEYADGTPIGIKLNDDKNADR